MRLATRCIFSLIVALAAMVLTTTEAHAMARKQSNPSGVRGSSLPAAGPAGATLARQAEIARIYDDAARIIRTDLGKAIATLAERPRDGAALWLRGRSAELLTRIDEVRLAAGIKARSAVLAAHEQAAQRGRAYAARQAVEAGVQAGSLRGGFDGFDAGAVDALARDTVARLDRALGGYAANAQTLVRTLSAGPLSTLEPEVNRALARGLITGNPRIADRAVRDLFRDPNARDAQTYRQIGAQQIEVGGWSGPVRAYVDTVVRTRTREATERSKHEALAEIGIDLVQIVGASSVNFCTRFLGLVCTLGPARDGYPALASLPGGGPPFHPNCSKSSAPYVEELASPRRAEAHANAKREYDRAVRNGTLGEDLRAA